jgi:Ribbon-helix-helix protein, copG family
MPSTTVHIPDDLLKKIDRFVANEGISRNKFIIGACKAQLEKGASRWPKAFFISKLNKSDRELLEQGSREMLNAILSNRKSRKPVDL